ncbi:hypothetical protein DDE05_12060 [Streptomyces cavourensis]|nr:hypothetical protein DDE05_12060 [Streptomyces cavourensis]
MKKLFDQSFDKSDSLWVLKVYFNIIYSDGNFIDAADRISRRWGFSTDGAYCRFPDMNSFDSDEHFEGVEFTYGISPNESTIIVSDKVCVEFLKRACEIYISRHPEYSLKITEIISRLPK